MDYIIKMNTLSLHTIGSLELNRILIRSCTRYYQGTNSSSDAYGVLSEAHLYVLRLVVWSDSGK